MSMTLQGRSCLSEPHGVLEKRMGCHTLGAGLVCWACDGWHGPGERLHERWPQPACASACLVGLRAANKARRCASRKIQLERQLQSERISEDEKLAQRQALQQQERDYIRLQRQRLSSEDFEALKLIGRGAFGEVRARHSCPCAGLDLGS